MYHTYYSIFCHNCFEAFLIFPFMQNKMGLSKRHLSLSKKKSDSVIITLFLHNVRNCHEIWRILLLFLIWKQNYLVSLIVVQLSLCRRKKAFITWILRNLNLLLRMKCYNQWLQPHHLERSEISFFKNKIPTTH